MKLVRAFVIFGAFQPLSSVVAADPPVISQPIEFHTPEADALLAKLQILPKDNAFHQAVDRWPLHPKS
jgi:hypothetical protein